MPVPVRCARSSVPPAGPGSRPGRSRRWCLPPDRCRRHGRGPVRRRSQGRAPLPPGLPEVWNASNRCSRALAGTPGPVSETSMMATRTFAAAGNANLHARGVAADRPSGACTALRARLSRMRNSWSGSASMLSPRSIALIQVINASEAKPVDSRTSATTGSIRSCGDRGRPPARGRRTASTGRTRWRAPASASVSARSAAPADRARWRAGRNQLRGGQQVAQIVVDLGHRKAKGGKPTLLMQHRNQVALHVGQFALRDADLVAALAGHDDERAEFSGSS